MLKLTKCLSVFLFIIFLFNNCSKREVIPVSEDNFIGFKFFLFAELDGEKFQGNGDAVIINNSLFKFRLYDNLLSKHVLSFQLSNDGAVQAYMMLDDTIYRYQDQELALILTRYLYKLFRTDIPITEEDDSVKEITYQDDTIQKISFDYGDDEFLLNIMKYFDDGDPRRIAIENDQNSVIFDITKFQDYDYPEPTTNEFQIFTIKNQKTFFEWLGDAYVR